MNFKIYVRAIIKNSLGEVLMLLKNKNQKIAAGKWVLPGGAIEFGETPTTALKRELKEEINFSIESSILVETETMIIEDTHWLGLYYEVTGNILEISNLEPEKHSELNWFKKTKGSIIP